MASQTLCDYCHKPVDYKPDFNGSEVVTIEGIPYDACRSCFDRITAYLKALKESDGKLR